MDFVGLTFPTFGTLIIKKIELINVKLYEYLVKFEFERMKFNIQFQYIHELKIQ